MEDQMAKQVKEAASGNAPGAGPVTTPAPTQRPPGSEKDFTFGRQSYGANAYGGPSSLTPGHKERASITVNNDDSDATLSAIKQHGSAAMRVPLPGDDVEDVRGTPATQIRDVSAANKTPVTFGHKDPNANPAKAPSALGASNGAPVRKPGA
jgi:hypothetical protein